ncbi:MAG: hypothetical protein ACI9JN_000432 [Bacteroidia bacterium]|jgi:hypothetical protein
MKKILLFGIIPFAISFLVFEVGSGPNVSQNGISTHQLASDIMSKYDLNSDGILDVTEESFLRTKLDNVQKTESRGLLFTDADTFGNNDGSVSKTELEAYL